MTNNCQSCTHSAQMLLGDYLGSIKLICLMPEMNHLDSCQDAPPNCKHYEYEAGTDGENE